MENLVQLPNFYEIKKGLTLSTKIPKNGALKEYTHFTVDGIALRINLNGSGNYKSLTCEYENRLSNNTTVFDMINYDVMGNSSFNLDDEHKFVNIIAHKDFLRQILPINGKTEELFEFFQSKQNIKKLSLHKNNPKTKIITQNILKNSYNKDLRYLFLESAVLEILYTEFDALFKQEDSKNNGVILSKSDIEAIYHAKEILEQNPAKPPSISQLSKMVALNEFKLKTGFKKILNQTPYSVFVNHRLKVAKNLLEKSDLNINEIANKVGYSSSSSFSNAFCKMYKIRPMDLMKKRKYYY